MTIHIHFAVYRQQATQVLLRVCFIEWQITKHHFRSYATADRTILCTYLKCAALKDKQISNTKPRIVIGSKG